MMRPANTNQPVTAQPSPDATGLLQEWLNPDTRFGFRPACAIATSQSPHQRIDVYTSEQFGAFYLLDGHFMASERDECICHECMVHPAALTHPAPRQVLVLGGGDGGSAKELLKYPSVERVVVAELDAEVVAMARAHLPGIHQGAFDHPKLDLRVGDARTYVAHALAGGERFDLVVFDLTAADGSAGPLHCTDFFADIRSLLTPDGMMTLQLGAPWFQPHLVRQLARDLTATFRYVRPMTAYIPLYGTLWALATASQTLDPAALPPAEAQARAQARGIGTLRYYDPSIHASLFALPLVIRELIDRSAP